MSTRNKTKSCSVSACNSPNNAIYHYFPKDPSRRKAWELACHRSLPLAKNPRICGNHFVEQDYKRDLRNELLGLPLKRRLNHHAVPSRGLLLSCPNVQAPNEEEERAVKLQRSQFVESIVKAYEENIDSPGIKVALARYEENKRLAKLRRKKFAESIVKEYEQNFDNPETEQKETDFTEAFSQDTIKKESLEEEEQEDIIPEPLVIIKQEPHDMDESIPLESNFNGVFLDTSSWASADKSIQTALPSHGTREDTCTQVAIGEYLETTRATMTSKENSIIAEVLSLKKKNASLRMKLKDLSNENRRLSSKEYLQEAITEELLKGSGGTVGKWNEENIALGLFLKYFFSEKTYTGFLSSGLFPIPRISNLSKDAEGTSEKSQNEDPPRAH